MSGFPIVDVTGEAEKRQLKARLTALKCATELATAPARTVAQTSDDVLLSAARFEEWILRTETKTKKMEDEG